MQLLADALLNPEMSSKKTRGLNNLGVTRPQKRHVIPHNTSPTTTKEFEQPTPPPPRAGYGKAPVACLLLLLLLGMIGWLWRPRSDDDVFCFGANVTTLPFVGSIEGNFPTCGVFPRTLTEPHTGRAHPTIGKVQNSGRWPGPASLLA